MAARSQGIGPRTGKPDQDREEGRYMVKPKVELGKDTRVKSEGGNLLCSSSEKEGDQARKDERSTVEVYRGKKRSIKCRGWSGSWRSLFKIKKPQSKSHVAKIQDDC
jgi:hypothetical protein